MDSERNLEEYLHRQIPLSKAMGVEVQHVAEHGVTLRVPIEPNLNHRKTVFGGSAAAAGTLSAWCLLWYRLSGLPNRPELVIHANNMLYSRPITGDFLSRSLAIEQPDWDRFISGIERKGRGRIRVKSVLEFDSRICGEFEGTFVALFD